MRAALHLGLFQLLFLDGIAPHTAVTEAVELAKPSPGHRLVNAVLRRVARDGSSCPPTTPAGAAVRHSHPEWLVRRWWDELGPEATRALLAVDNEPGELALRINTLVTDEPPEGLEGRRKGDAFVLAGRRTSRPTGLAQGAFTVQSRGAQRVAATVAPQPGERVLDLCAAPGGKTTHLAALMAGGGRSSPSSATRQGPRPAGDVRAPAGHERDGRRGRAAAFADPGGFDRVLLDPPCSGLGTLRTHPDLRWHASEAGITRLAALQDHLLEAARGHLRAGGSASWCTPCARSRPRRSGSSPDHWRTLPHRDATDGFYTARDGRV